MRAAIRARLARLEAGRRASGRSVPIFVSGDPRTDFEAKIASHKAELIRSGRASEGDSFTVFQTVYEARSELVTAGCVLDPAVR